MASEMLIPALATMANPTLGARANAAANPDAATEATARKRMTSAGSLAMSRVPMRAPIVSPISWMGSTQAATTPRWYASRPKASS